MASPFLMFPIARSYNQEIHELHLFSLRDKKSHNISLLQSLIDFQCVGSSHGWLAFSNGRGTLFLLNPFSGAQIDLPYTHLARVVKVVLSMGTPSHDKNYVVIAMYKDRKKTKLAFCRHGEQKWHNLDCKDDKCYDIVTCDETNMVFALGPGLCVEAWDLKERDPRKTMTIQESRPRKLVEAHEIFSLDLHTIHRYLALSQGHIFLVVRYIGKFVTYDGRVVSQEEILANYASEHLLCPYRTLGFYVFKFDVAQRNWIEVKSLNEFALFVGGNESMMLSIEDNAELKGNSIYFTDDYWDRVDEDSLYGGHDMGIFKMEDGTIEPIMERQKEKIKPLPFWISLPPPC